MGATGLRSSTTFTSTGSSGANGINYENYLDILDAYQPTAAYSVSVWVKVPAVQAMGIIGRTTSSGIGAVESDDLHITSSGVFEHYTQSASGTGYTVTGTTAIQPNTWYNVAIVATAGGQELLYVNGVSQGTPQSIPSLSTTGDRWQVGTPPSGYSYFAGELGGLTIFHNVALTSSQIASIASGSVAPLSLIPYTAQVSIQEFFPLPEGHNIVDPQLLSFTTNVLSWTLPNGIVNVTNFITQASSCWVEGYWGPEWNPAGIGSPGGDMWYTFVTPASQTLYINNPYSSSVSEYLAAFSPYSQINNNSPITRAWNSISYSANAGQQYWLESGINGQGQTGVSLVLSAAPGNDVYGNATLFSFQSIPTVNVLLDGVVTNYTLTANLTGNNYEATLDNGEFQSAFKPEWQTRGTPSGGPLFQHPAAT